MKLCGAAVIVLLFGVGALVWNHDRTEEQKLALISEQLDRLASELQRPPIVLAPEGEAMGRLPARPDAGPVVASVAAVPVPAPTRPPALQSAAQIEAVADAQRTLDDVLFRGHLTTADVEQLRDTLSQANDPQARHEIHRQIAKAITNRQLVPDDRRQIFP